MTTTNNYSSLDSYSSVSVLPQPKALKILFLAELWERFSFYGMRGLLIFYLTSQNSYTNAKAYSLYGVYLALVYATTILGGYLADQFLGKLKAIKIGGMFIVFGHVLLSVPEYTIFIYGLACVLIGTSLFKTNISALLGEYYGKNDPRRDAGFTLFYMGVNAGSLIAPLICGYIGVKYGWHYAFACAGVGMILGMYILLHFQHHLEGKGAPPQKINLDRKIFLKISYENLITFGCLLMVPLFAYFILHHEMMGNFLNIFGIIVFIVLLVLMFQCQGRERSSMLTILVMLPFTTAFFACFEQAGASMNLFTDRYVNRMIGSFEIPSTWFQSLNPLFVVLLAPFFSSLWGFSARHKKDFLTPDKFILALIQVGLSFLFLESAVQEAASLGKSSLSWLVLAYLLQTTGELCLNPVGLSMVTKLSPPRFVSFMMSCFFLSIAFANLMAQQVAHYFTSCYEQQNNAAHFLQEDFSLQAFGDIFHFLIYFPIAASLLLLIISPFLKKIFKYYQ